MRGCGFLKLPKSTIVLGYVCLVAVVFQWVTSGFISQYVTSDREYKCTITQTVYTLCFYSVLLVPHLWRAYRSRNAPTESGADQTPLQFVLDNKLKVLILGSLWLCGQVVYMMSLLYTSMGTNTAVSSSSSAFSFIFSILILGYAFRWLSGLGVALTISGVVLTALFPAEVSESNTTITETVEGIIMAVCAAACFGLFSCLFKKWIVKDSYGSVVFGSFGVVSFMIGVPFIVIVHFAGLQAFKLPDAITWLVITADAILCCFVNNVCLSRAFIYLTPVVVLVGLTMTTPLSMFADAVIFSHHTYSTLNIVGITLITISVLVVGYDQAVFEKTLEQRASSSDIVKENTEATLAAPKEPVDTVTE